MEWTEEDLGRRGTWSYLRRVAKREHPNRAPARDPLRNSRGGLHGPAALHRVLGSERLRRDALRGMSELELLDELERRRRAAAANRLARIAAIVVRLVAEVVR